MGNRELKYEWALVIEKYRKAQKEASIQEISWLKERTAKEQLTTINNK